MQKHPILHRALVGQDQAIELLWRLPSEDLVIAAYVPQTLTHGAGRLLLGALDPPLATFVTSCASPQLASPTASDHRVRSYCLGPAQARETRSGPGGPMYGFDAVEYSQRKVETTGRSRSLCA